MLEYNYQKMKKLFLLILLDKYKDIKKKAGK